MKNEIALSFTESSALLSRINQTNYPEAVLQAARLISGALSRGRKLLIFGNGGSASDAQHIAGELVGRFRINRRPLPALALAGDAAVLTCIANDFGYNEAFSRQIRALGAPGDIAWALSTSGNSENVVDGLKVARENGLVTILMTGKGGGRASAHADLLLDVPSANTAHIQEIHMISYHAICSALERELFAEAEA